MFVCYDETLIFPCQCVRCVAMVFVVAWVIIVSAIFLCHLCCVEED